MKTEIIHEEWKAVKGRIAVFIMSFSGDKSCLTQCLRGIDEQKKNGYDLTTFIIDDANSPLELTEEEHSRIHYRKSYFARNCNLNGTQCAHGMLMEMLRCARESQAEYILKVDCDMYIRSLDRFLTPLKQDPNAIIGFKLSKDMCYCAGVTYLLPTVGLYKAIRDFHKWYKNAKENTKEWITHCPEDWAITRCVTAVNDYTMYQWDNSTDADPSTWLLAPFNYKEVEKDGTISPLAITRFAMYDFVNFGNRYDLDKECKCAELLNTKEPRQIAGEFMAMFADYDLLNFLPL